jgi:hypothetical protein
VGELFGTNKILSDIIKEVWLQLDRRLNWRNATSGQHFDLSGLITGPLHAVDMAGPDARVLSFHDVLLRSSDVDLLKGPDWLNDQVQAVFTAVGTLDRGRDQGMHDARLRRRITVSNCMLSSGAAARHPSPSCMGTSTTDAAVARQSTPVTQLRPQLSQQLLTFLSCCMRS